ncbi:hypothetical protein HY524_01970 [Candidatus Berkelbacteria bacterium]|nr:hypothetical protein [Candidatus Berkelbacteria bacterium]
MSDEAARVRNTSAKQHREENLIMGLAHGDAAIYMQEKQGQQDLIESSSLPTKGSDNPAFKEMGIIFGEPFKDDPLFRPAQLPPGWTVKGSDHDMWSYLYDDKGEKRASIFYKAAFYDRKAHISPA